MVVISIPVKCGKRDSKGYFCQYGSQKKYYYDPDDKSSRDRARKKAEKQGKAINTNKSEEIIPEIGEKEAKCDDCEPKLDEIDQKTPESAEKTLKIAEITLKTDKIEQKIEEIEEKIPKYEPPEDKNSLNEGHFVRFKDKIGKIIKVIQ